MWGYNKKIQKEIALLCRYHLILAQIGTSKDIMVVQNFAKSDTENAELADAQTAAFSASTQNLYNQIPSRSSSSEPIPDDTCREFF